MLKNARPRLRTIDTRSLKPEAKHFDPYYSSPEHREWRKAVLQRAGHRCEDPEHDGERAVRVLYADHIVERRDGGSATDVANGMARCAACHVRKTARVRAQRMTKRSVFDSAT